MSSLSRLSRALLLLVPAALLAAACAAPGAAPTGDAAGQSVSIGVADASESYWSVYKAKAAEAGITVGFVNFTDYNQPNPALSQGQLQLNEFQHLQYLANYNVKNNDTWCRSARPRSTRCRSTRRRTPRWTRSRRAAASRSRTTPPTRPARCWCSSRRS